MPFRLLGPWELLALAVVVLLFAGAGLSSVDRPEPSGYHALADGVKGGHAWVSVDSLPPPAPSNRPELVTYAGNTYFSWGFGPSAMVFGPWRVLTGNHLPERWVALALALVSTFFSVAFLFRLFTDALSIVPAWVRASALIAAAGGNLSLFLLRNADGSDIALLWSQAWIACAAYACTHAFESGPRVVSGTTWTSLALGLAATGHPSALPLCALSFVLWLCPSPVLYWRSGHRASSFFLPAFLLIVGVVAFNHLRFGLLFESGSLLDDEGNSRISEELFDPSALKDSASGQIADATVTPWTWSFTPPCHGNARRTACLPPDAGLPIAFASAWLVIAMPLLLVARRFLVMNRYIENLRLPVPITLFFTGAIVIQFTSALSGFASSVDPAHPPVALDWACSMLGICFGLHGYLIAREETGWTAISLLVVPVSFVLSVAQAVRVSGVLG
jgi:hypothetical protein